MPRAASYLIAIFVLVSLAGCPASPGDAYGWLFVTPQTGTSGDDSSSGFICKGGSAVVRWELMRSSQATLSAFPLKATLPELDRRSVRRVGELNIRVLDSATFFLDVGENTTERRLSLIPSYLCEDFPAPPLGAFTGALEQTSPTPQTLQRQLYLEWDEYGLRGHLSSDASPYASLSLTCTADVATATLRCADGASLSFELNAAVRAEGLTGTYQGVVRDATSSSTFSGTLNFKRAP